MTVGPVTNREFARNSRINNATVVLAHPSQTRLRPRRLLFGLLIKHDCCVVPHFFRRAAMPEIPRIINYAVFPGALLMKTISYRFSFSAFPLDSWLSRRGQLFPRKLLDC